MRSKQLKSQELDAAVKGMPHDPDALADMAEFLREQMRDLDKAEVFYKRAIESNPRSDGLGAWRPVRPPFAAQRGPRPRPNRPQLHRCRRGPTMPLGTESAAAPPARPTPSLAACPHREAECRGRPSAAPAQGRGGP